MDEILFFLLIQWAFSVTLLFLLGKSSGNKWGKWIFYALSVLLFLYVVIYTALILVQRWSNTNQPATQPTPRVMVEMLQDRTGIFVQGYGLPSQSQAN